MNMCFDCEYRTIYTNGKDLDCLCVVDARYHNPYRPMILPDRDCPNWKRKEDGNAETVRN